MSIASYFFVGSADEAARNDGLEGGQNDWRAEFYRLTDLSLKPLYSILSGKECPKFVPVCMNDDYTQITFEFPSAFVEQLNSIDAPMIAQIASQWLGSGEAPYDTDSDLRSLVSALSSLGKVACQSNLGLYLWNAA
jgi:hypothetical protein